MGAPKGVPSGKSNVATCEERVEIVMEMLLSGLTRRAIIQYVRKNERLQWSVGDRDIDRYIKKANDAIKKVASASKEQILEDCKSKFAFLYKKMIAVKDYKGARDTQKMLSDVTGSTAAQKIESNVHVDLPQIIVSETQKKLIDGL